MVTEKREKERGKGKRREECGRRGKIRPVENDGRKRRFSLSRLMSVFVVNCCRH